jgi:hypothetical protein
MFLISLTVTEIWVFYAVIRLVHAATLLSHLSTCSRTFVITLQLPGIFVSCATSSLPLISRLTAGDKGIGYQPHRYEVDDELRAQQARCSILNVPGSVC